MINQVGKCLDDKLDINMKLLNNLERRWQKIEKDFWGLIQIFMPENYHYIKNVEVRITSFGAISSYKFLKKQPNQKFICYLRKDGGLPHLAEAIISGLLYPNNDSVFFSWEEHEAMVDFILTKSCIASLFPQYKPTLPNLKSKNSQLIKESNDYPRHLKISFKKPFKIDGDKIYLNDTLINNQLTESQNNILQLLLSHEADVVTVDAIGNVLWTNEDEYSLWALNKAMQRLRSKLIALGAPPFCLHTLRGQGYSLVNG
jgi:hypothetical protein